MKVVMIMRAFRRPRRTCRGAWANTECGTGGLIVNSLCDLVGLRLSDPKEPVTSETRSLAAKVLWYCWSSTKHEDRLFKNANRSTKKKDQVEKSANDGLQA